MAKKKNQGNHNEKQIDGIQKNKENDGTITLSLDMHCEDCAVKVVNFVSSLDGVESVKRRENNWKEITVVGKIDPVKLRENVVKKIQKKPKEQNESGGEHKKQQNDAVKDENDHKQFPVTTAVLKVSLNCQGCIKKIRKLVRETEGFVEMSIDKDLVTVKGAMDMNVLATKLKKKLKRQVEIVQVKGLQGRGGGGKKGKGGGGDGLGEERGGRGRRVAGYEYRNEYFSGQGQYMYRQYVDRPEDTFNYMHATQMFDDENPNACVVM